MVKYRIPLSDKDALAKFRVEQEVEKNGKIKVKGKPIVKSWNVILDAGIVVIEAEKEVEGLEKYKV